MFARAGKCHCCRKPGVVGCDGYCGKCSGRPDCKHNGYLDELKKYLEEQGYELKFSKDD